MSAPVFDPPRHRRPAPNPTPFTEPFWEGTRIGELRLQCCSDCGHYRWTPQIACPRCWSESAEWRATSGKGDEYYWQAQLRMLQILSRTGRNTQRIAPHIQRLRHKDATLGGERFRREFERLQSRHPAS